MQLTLLLLALAGQAPDAGHLARRKLPDIDLTVTKQVAYTEVGNRMTVDGRPIHVWAVRSKSKLGDLLQSYIERFERAGYYLPHDVKIDGLDLPKVVALDPINFWSFLVWGFPERDGTTTVIIGVADVTERPKESAKGQLPVFPGAKSKVVSNVEAGNMLAFATSATEAEVLDFYRQVLPTGGFTEREPGTFVREGRKLRVMAQQKGATLSVVVLDQPDAMPEPWLEEARQSVH